MRERQGRKGPTTGLSGKERGAIEEFLAYVEERMKEVEPVCPKLVRMARLSLGEPENPRDPGRPLH